MSSVDPAESREHIESLIDEQKQLFIESEIIQSMRSHELLLGQVALSCTTSPSLYRGFPAKVLDNPKTDTITVLVDKPTIQDLVDEYAEAGPLTADDIVKLYVGSGFANMLILHGLAATRMRRMEKFFSKLSEPLNLYSRTMDSAVFDDASADETARRIVADGHAQTARVNALRLRTGMFIEVQPDPSEMRDKVEHTFQAELREVFDGKPLYLQTVGYFDIEAEQAEGPFANTAESALGLAFPMNKKEVKQLLGIL